MEKRIVEWVKNHKVISVSAGVALTIIFIIVSATSPSPRQKVSSNTTSTVQTKQVELKVEWQNTKPVGTKYRYFFRIVNENPFVFDGSIRITVISKNGSDGGGDTFTGAIPPQEIRLVYFDLHTSNDESIHGDYAVSSFKYTATM